MSEIAALDPARATARMQEIYAAPIQPELITARLKEIRSAGVTVAGALSPQRTHEHWRTVVDAGVVHRIDSRGDPAAGRRRQGHLCPLRRCGFGSGGDLGPPGSR